MGKTHKSHTFVLFLLLKANYGLKAYNAQYRLKFIILSLVYGVVMKSSSLFKNSFRIILCLYSIQVFSYPCENQSAFKEIETIHSKVTAFKIERDGNKQIEKEICSGIKELSVYDVRNREAEAYHCLKPKTSQITQCPTSYKGNKATISIVPASWIRLGKDYDFRSYRFHAYVVPNNPGYATLDIFSRTLSPRLESQYIILEGSKLSSKAFTKTEGFWIRVEFFQPSFL